MMHYRLWYLPNQEEIHVSFSYWWQIYYHGDPIPINVKVKNETNKVVKKIKITGEIDQKQFQVIHKLYV